MTFMKITKDAWMTKVEFALYGLILGLMMTNVACKSSKPTTTQPVVNANRMDTTWIDSEAPRTTETREEFDLTLVPGKIHRVHAGETLWSLSERYYGHGKHWRKILVANRKRLTDSTELPVGMKLIIP